MKLHRFHLLGLGVLGVSLISTACGGGAAPTATVAPQPTGTAPPRATATLATGSTATAAPTATRAPQATAAATPTLQATAAPIATTAAKQLPLLRIAVSDLRTFGFIDGDRALRYYSEPLYDDMVGAWANGQYNAESGFATSWTTSGDGKTITFKTRQGVVFHNGDPATAKDVKFTHEFLQTPGLAGAQGPRIKGAIASIDTPDDTTVVYNLTKPSLSFFDEFMTLDTDTGQLLPKKYLETVGRDAFHKAPVGSGPYKLKEANVGKSIVYEALDKHWYYGVPKFKILEYDLVPEDVAKLALLKSGRAEVIEATRASSVELKQAKFDLAVDSDSFVGVLNFHEQYKETIEGYGKNPLANEKVRNALSLAIDRKLLVSTFMKGLAEASVDYPIGSRNIAYKAHPVPAQDLVRAKALLAEAGYPNAFEIDVIVSSWGGLPEGPDVMEAISVWWEKIGVKVNRKPVELSKYLADWQKQAYPKPTVHGPAWNPNRKWPSIALSASSAYRTTLDPDLIAAYDELGRASSTTAYGPAAQQVADRFISKAAIPALFTGGSLYAVQPGLGGDKWSLGQASKSIHIKQLAAGKDG